jgi:hypothetical protein
MLDYGGGRRKPAIWSIDAVSRPLHHMGKEFGQKDGNKEDGLPPPNDYE